MKVKTITNTFFKGLAAIVPVILTISIIAWLLRGMERVLGRVVQWVLPDGWYIPGVGVVLGLVGVFFVGLLLRAWLFRKIWEAIESLIGRTPVVKYIYGAIRDLLQYIGGSATAKARQVVVVRVSDDPPLRMVGLLTRQDLGNLPAGLNHPDTVVVYLPMSYQMGGYSALVPRSRIEPVDIDIQDALRFVVTAGMASGTERPPDTNKSGPVETDRT